MSQNGQTHFKRLAAKASRFLSVYDNFGTLRQISPAAFRLPENNEGRELKFVIMMWKRTDLFFITEVIIFVFACFLISKLCLCHEYGIKVSLMLPSVNFGENHFYSPLLNGKRVKPVLNT